MMKKFLVVAVALMAFGIGAIEVYLRMQYGLTTPTLYSSHPTIEYVAKPGQDVRIYGNRQLYNDLSMRSPSLDQTDHDRLVLVFGDSVLNGGNILDQAEIATTLASKPEGQNGNRILFGNVSAKSWGPANLLGWVDENGFREADTAIFVLSSHDAYDLPTFEPLDPAVHPTEPPALALSYVLSRVAARFLPARPAQADTPPTEDEVARGLSELATLIGRAADAGLRVCLVQHLTRSEIITEPKLGYAEIRSLFAGHNIPVLNLGDEIRGLKEAANDPFIDDIHINADGQALLVKLIKDCAELAVVPS